MFIIIEHLLDMGGEEVMSFTFSFIHLCTQLLIQPMFIEPEEVSGTELGAR